MTNVILKVAFPYRDERLYPPGWRSFSNECWSIQNIELTPEITARFAIEGPSTNEIISVNDLTYITEEVICVVQLEISNEIIGSNYLADEIAKEVTGINYLSEEKTTEIYGLNDLNSAEIATKEIIGLNSMRETVSFEEYSHTISLFLDDSLITEYVKDWSISISEDSYVHSINVNFVNSVLFSQCDTSVKIGKRRIKLIIDSIEFQFLLEKRDVTRAPSVGEFGVWGRSLIAILDLPYAVPIIDKDVVQDSTTGIWSCPDDGGYVPHIWQTGDWMASEIMDAVIKSPFTTTDFSLNFRLNDYLVRQGALSVSNSSPIKIINQLAAAVGGRVRTDLLDRVIVKPFKFDEVGAEVATYTDSENILQLSESLSFPGGYNRILVNGWKDPLVEGSVGIKIELDSVLNEEETTFTFGEEIWIRVYVSPFTLEYNDPICSLGTVYPVTLLETTTITEEKAVFVGGSMQLSYPVNTITTIQRYDCSFLTSSQYTFTQGYDFVTSEDSDLQDEPVVITYTTKSDLYKLVVNQPCDPLPWFEVLSKITIRQA